MDFFLKNDFGKKYENLDEIGKGTYGSVYEIKNKTTNKIYACKKIEITDEISYCVYNELIAWKTFNHPNIIKILDVCTEKKESTYLCYIIMERCDTSLSQIILNDKQSIEPIKRIKYLEGIMAGLLYMWKKGYVHNDLSLSNILIKNDEVKIIDFGFIYNRYAKQHTYHKITQYVQPPELIMGLGNNCHNDKIDTWSLGHIFYAICYGDVMLHWDTKNQYYLDLISKTKNPPTLKIIKKHKLFNKYVSVYYKVILGTTPPKHLSVDNDKIIEFISELILHNQKSEYFTNYLPEKTRENKFIKKLINWNPIKRPNIVRAYELYLKIFPERKYAIKNIPREINFDATSVNVNYVMEHSSRNIWANVLNYVYLFRYKPIFKIHFDNKIMKNNKMYYDMNIKTMHLMSQLWQNIYQQEKKGKILGKILYQPNDTLINSDLEKLEKNFDRFYSFADIIYYHNNYYDAFVLSDQTVKITEMSTFQYYFINAMQLQINFFDAWNIFTSKKINKLYERYYKFVYYLYLACPLISSIDNRHIYTAIMLLIMSYKDNNIKQNIVKQFTKINDITKFVLGIDKVMPQCLTSKTYNITNKMIIPNKKYDLNEISIDSYIIAYHLIWTIKKLPPITYTSINKKPFNVESKFIEHIQNYFTFINI
ncbi:putative serine/threonine-protein kinase [Tupanvirus deep ocean]|uniref:Serine/threonine-protein kinase n=2 Tax=Tupanvirus TaxID=2094720 RepID=A0AC62A967_9VIRU|nr:putative serine/threonine-protein kinase [Tupanvirus deep ocean]QKU34304.1 putative serine/threonine-protein kinase [Tupanvirus deep ocean]